MGFTCTCITIRRMTHQMLPIVKDNDPLGSQKIISPAVEKLSREGRQGNLKTYKSIARLC